MLDYTQITGIKSEVNTAAVVNSVWLFTYKNFTSD